MIGWLWHPESTKDCGDGVKIIDRNRNSPTSRRWPLLPVIHLDGFKSTLATLDRCLWNLEQFVQLQHQQKQLQKGSNISVRVGAGVVGN